MGLLYLYLNFLEHSASLQALMGLLKFYLSLLEHPGPRQASNGSNKPLP